MRKSLLSIVPLMLSISIAHADPSEPSHDCQKPDKPYQFTSQWKINSFNYDVERYKQCIAAFIDDQKQEIENHKAAIQQATDDWNTFAADLN